MKSPSTINYEIRPCKFAERKMLLISFSRIIGAFKSSFQYIGFGGLSFTDFKLFHKELNIETMYSIEAGYNIEKLNFNKPFSCITILQGNSTDMLGKLDLKKPSIVWLDYDDTLSMTVFDDINILFNVLPSGSIYVMSCNRELKNKETALPLTEEELHEKFNDIAPYHMEKDGCAEPNVHKTLFSMITGYCNRVINDRNKLGENLEFTPLYNFKYNENRGARMYTCGGIILDKSFDESKLNIDDLDFIKSEEVCEIKIPNITQREASYLNQNLNDIPKEQDLINRKILTDEDIKVYKSCYKFIPNFYDVRL